MSVKQTAELSGAIWMCGRSIPHINPTGFDGVRRTKRMLIYPAVRRENTKI